jgi:hypothetical protein
MSSTNHGRHAGQGRCSRSIGDRRRADNAPVYEALDARVRELAEAFRSGFLLPGADRAIEQERSVVEKEHSYLVPEPPVRLMLETSVVPEDRR